MMRLLICSLLLLMVAGADARERVPPAPFTLPVRAKIVETAADGKGWKANGEMPVSFQQAQAQLTAKVSAAGWAHLHTIPLGSGRVLEAWSRGSEELTLMVWRIAPGKSGFSYGLSSKAGAGVRK